MDDCCGKRKRPGVGVGLVLGALALVGVLIAFGSGSPRRQSEPSAPATLEQEIDGAYPRTTEASGAVREFDLTAAPARLALLGRDDLAVWAYNGQVPGPVLRVKTGDTVRVHFENRLPQATTVHWHGVRVPNAMDGVPGVTQPPVEPGGSFLYEFVARDAGTFWFHPHLRSSEQVERGLFGVLIVEDTEPPPYSRELVWVIDDWKLDESGQIAAVFNTRHELAHDGRWGNVVTVNGARSPAIDVQPGERVRVRVVNVANGRVFRLDWAGLAPAGIAVDGLYAREPFDVTAFDVAPGNRLDVDLVVPASARGKTFEIVDGYTRQRHVVARLRVADVRAVETPAFSSPARGHVPSWAAATSAPVAKELALSAEQGGPWGIRWTIAGTAMRHDVGEHAHDVLFTLPQDRFSRLAFVNESGRIHPMHLHGTFFKVIARGGVPADEPFFRDTVLVKPRERVDIGLVPFDEGTWMMHCHILEHAESGMMSLFRVERP